MRTLTERQNAAIFAADPPPRLALLASYFDLTGTAMAAILIVGPLFTLINIGRMSYQGGPMTIFTWTAGMVSALGFIWTGRELRRCSRTAWWAATITLADPLFALARGAHHVGPVSAVLAGIGICVLASVWRELR